MEEKLRRAVKSRAGPTIHGYWTAGPGHDAENPCYIVPAAEYERLTRKARHARTCGGEMTRRKLKPCPFCGGRAVHKTSWAPDNLAVARIVYCAREIMCGANLHVLFPVTQDEAAKHWNARAK